MSATISKTLLDTVSVSTTGEALDVSRYTHCTIDWDIAVTITCIVQSSTDGSIWNTEFSKTADAQEDLSVKSVMYIRAVTSGESGTPTCKVTVALSDKNTLDLDVPSIDGALNTTVNEVLGNKSDTSGGDSAMALLQLNNELIDSITTNDGVPTADAATNVYVSDVVGNKTDSTAGDSLYSLNLINKAAIDAITTNDGVATADAATNVYVSDVVGNKDDTTAGTSLVALAKQNAAAIVVTDAVADGIATNIEAAVADAAGNTQMSDVVGNKSDADNDAGSVIARLGALDAVSDAILVDTTAIEVDTTSIESKVDGLVLDVAVPGQDAAGNLLIGEVIGMKTDTTSGTSLVGIAKSIVADLALPTADLATNTEVGQVIGNKDDTAAGTSIVGIAKSLVEDLALPTADLATNTQIGMVIGNKDDTTAGTSLMAYAKRFGTARVLASAHSSVAVSSIGATAVGTGTGLSGLRIQRPWTDSASTEIKVGDGTNGTDLRPGGTLEWWTSGPWDTISSGNYSAVPSSPTGTNNLEVEEITPT